jgi:hypothetical protein
MKMRDIQLLTYTEMNDAERAAFGAQWRQGHAAFLLQETDKVVPAKFIDYDYDQYLGQEGYSWEDERRMMSRDRLYVTAKDALEHRDDLRAVDIVVDFDAGLSVLVQEAGVHYYIAPIEKPEERTFNVFDMKAYVHHVRGWLAGDRRAKTKPAWEHTCDGCVFKGTFLSGKGATDLYDCGDSIVARFGNADDEYSSTLKEIALREGAEGSHKSLMRNAMWLIQGRL